MRVTRSASLLVGAFLSALLALSSAERVEFSSGSSHSITQNYPSDNLYVLNGTTLTLDLGFNISAPASNDEGTQGVRVSDSTFLALSGTITGAPTTSGAAVYVTRSRITDFDARAEFFSGMVVVGGDASREKTTKAGSAIIVANLGAEVVIHGGSFAPGKGCSFNTCGTVTEDGDCIQVLQGKVVIKGGSFSGNFDVVSGEVVIHGCVENENKRITGFLADGSGINIPHTSCDNCIKIEYMADACPLTDETPTDSGAWKNGMLLSVSGASSFIASVASVAAWLL